MRYYKWRIMAQPDGTSPMLVTWRVHLGYFRRKWPETFTNEEYRLIKFVGDEIIQYCTTKSIADARIRYVINRLRRI